MCDFRGDSGQRASADAGFSLVEVLIASLILTTGLLTLAQLFTISTRSNLTARATTYASILAEQKLEELRGLTWGFDLFGFPLSDTASDTASPDSETTGGTGLSPSPAATLREDTAGWVDYVDQFGHTLGGGADRPTDAIYIRRWSVTPHPVDPSNVLVLQVLVFRIQDRYGIDGSMGRLTHGARLATVKVRKAR